LSSDHPEGFDEALVMCGARGYHGVNVTHPFKERAARCVHVAPGQVRQLGAINTIRFDRSSDPQGFNTDYTGFMKAFKAGIPGRSPGVVAIAGAGGVGRAIAFGLANLGASEIRLFDADTSKCTALAMAFAPPNRVKVRICTSIEHAANGADGLVNATPLGMYHHPGTAFPPDVFAGQSWVFDAVYTPTDTRFMQDAQHAGLAVLSGYELFFHQGVDAFEIFSGIRVDETQLRAALAGPPVSKRKAEC
jgi:shikimate dehydrogenase